MTERNTGATTEQMKQAPRDALYIWPNRHSLDYANALAHHLGRDDLEITSLQILDDGGMRLRGRRFSAYIVDHACEPTNRQFDTLDRLRQLGARGAA
jgi:hypothetical protein